MENQDIATSVEKIKDLLASAHSEFLNFQRRRGGRNDSDELAKHYLEKSFIHTLVLCDQLGMDHIYQRVEALYEEAKDNDFLKSRLGPHDPYLVWAQKIREFIVPFESGITNSHQNEIDSELVSVIRDSVYKITDPKTHDTPPQEESDVHNRVEELLDSAFPEAQRKPNLNKPIKNFEADTGLPSLSTLVEYKFLKSSDDVGRIADEVLADTQGYVSTQWDDFVSVIYETRPFRSESKWNRLLDATDPRINTKILVLTGVPVDSDFS